MTTEATGRRTALKRLGENLKQIADAKVRAKILFYGNKGSGKSVAAGDLARRLAKGGKILYIDSSEGYVSLRNHPSITRDNNFFVQEFTNLEDLNLIAAAVGAGIPPYDDVKVIVMDELSKMTSFRIGEIVREQHPGDSIPDWTDWRILANEVRAMVALFFRAAGVHIIAIAHERVVTAGKEQKVIFDAAPDFNPSVLKVVAEDMHVVARFTATEIKRPGNDTPTYERLAQAHPTFRIDAKSRVGGLPVKMESTALVKSIANWIDAGAPEVDVRPTETAPEELRVAMQNTETDTEPDWTGND